MVKKVDLKINGKTIPLTEFPNEFIQNTIMGMVSSLKKVPQQIETLCITISDE